MDQVFNVVALCGVAAGLLGGTLRVERPRHTVGAFAPICPAVTMRDGARSSCSRGAATNVASRKMSKLPKALNIYPNSLKPKEQYGPFSLPESRSGTGGRRR
jgi:hypothetical protein